MRGKPWVEGKTGFMTSALLKTVEQRLLWLSHWMIHNANHLRENVDGIKVGGTRRPRLQWCRS